jgi:hypothetical protein
MGEHFHADGTITLSRDDDPSITMDVASQSELAATRATFFGPDMTMPNEVPMHQVRMFLIATNRLTQITNFLNSLPEPQRSLAKTEFEYAPNYVPTSSLGRAAQAALVLSDVDYAEAVRNMAAFTVDDYGSPRPTVLQAIAKFLSGG